MKHLLALLLLAAPAAAQFPATLARVPVTSFASGHLNAEAGHHGAGATVVLCVIPPTTSSVEVTWERAEGACYEYENLTDHDLGVQTGATAALHYIKANGQTVDAISKWFGWGNHDCKAYDGQLDWAGSSGYWRHAVNATPPPRTFILEPSLTPRVLTYTLGGSVSSSTWPSGHGYPLRAKAHGAVTGSWRVL